LKKLLIISYYFPPCGGAAVQRWLRLLPLLDKAGFDITVLTTQDGDFPVKDETLLSKLPPSVQVIRTFTPVFGRIWKGITHKDEPLPYGSLDGSQTTSLVKRLMYWIRLNLIAPDARVIWNPFAQRKAMQLCREKGIDWVITTGPPHSTHLIGLYLKKHIRFKWLADFRDPWTQIYYLKMESQNSLIRMINKHWEKKVLKQADLNLVISHDIASQLPNGRKKVFYNGFDAEQFSSLKYKRSTKFRIKYIGQLTAGQDITSLLSYLSENAFEHMIKEFDFSFVGTKAFEHTPLHFDVNFIGYLPHEQALAEMVNCEVLILLINSYTDNLGMLTTKLFEYIASGTPVLCIGPANGEAAEIVRQAQAGFVDDKLSPELWNYLIDLYHHWQQANPVRNDHDISQWSVQQQVKELISLFSC
jgi:glycosyltransferase involved in cell wall biosynthesis